MSMQEDTSLIDELKESMRAENLERFWQRFGNMVESKTSMEDIDFSPPNIFHPME